jgi:hypothetical protein
MPKRQSITNPIYTDNDIDEDLKLTRSDYMKILHHYRRPGSQPMRTASTASISTKTAKKRVHRILAEKLCRCIKPTKDTPTTMMTRARKKRASAYKSRRIAYCTRSIFMNKKLRRHGFRCKSIRGDQLRPRFTTDLTKSAKDLILRRP